jgi:glycosyltransferase involved in cell wall biosynthesis
MQVKRKALVVTTVSSTIDQFCMNDISILLQNYDVQVAANFTTGNNTSEERINEFKNELQMKNITINEIPFDRNPGSSNNIKAYKKLKRLINQNGFDLIHCHTPIAAMLTRLAARKMRKEGTKVFYTAHGFHFYKGASFINWLIYYPIERWLSKYTDVLITINTEDYERAKSNFKAKKVEHVSGVGIDLGKFNKGKIDKEIKRKDLNLPKDAFIILSVGELNKNKNHEVVIKALAKLNNSKVHYVICGQGKLDESLRNLSIELAIEGQVHLLGFRKDIPEICKISDLFVFPSFREGLSVALMEAMANGLPVVCSKIRGNSDLIEDGKGGNLVEPNNIDGFRKAIDRLISDSLLRNEFSCNNLKQISKYSIENVITDMERIYFK